MAHARDDQGREGGLAVTEPKKSILEQGQQEVARVVEALGDDDKIAVAATAGNDGGKVGVAVDVGKGLKVGGEVEKSATGWGWFIGGLFRKKK